MSQAAGAALPWWWDTYIEPFDLYSHFAALSAFQEGEDRRSTRFVPWTATIARAGGDVQIQGIISRTSCYGFLHDPEIVRNPGLAPKPRLLEEGHFLTVRGMMDGMYTVERWDTYEGKPTERYRIECRDRALRFPLPASKRDWAFKMKAEKTVEMEALAE
jgi:hypothetical protein